MYCESCIASPMQGIPRCQICQSLHPNGIPSVCLVLEHFLEEQFSEIYAERREAFAKQTDCQYAKPLTYSLSFPLVSVWTSFPNLKMGY